MFIFISDSSPYNKGYGSKSNHYNTGNIYTSSPPLTRYNSAGKGLNRPHTFVTKTVIKPENCNPVSMPCLIQFKIFILIIQII